MSDRNLNRVWLVSEPVVDGGDSFMTEPMEFGLLGPLVVRCGGLTVPVPRGKQRAVLAALLLNANQTVSLDSLAEALWGLETPPSARVTVQNYVKRLRILLGQAHRTRISTEPRGYRMHVKPGELDVSRFGALAHATLAAAREKEWELTADSARAALALWRGDPLTDVEAEVLAAKEVPPLVEMRLQVLEARLGAHLQLGWHAVMIPELCRLIRQYPLRERLYRLQMLALHRDGQRGAALAVYRQARRVLLEELGTEPSPDLRELNQRILAGRHLPETMVTPADAVH